MIRALLPSGLSWDVTYELVKTVLAVIGAMTLIGLAMNYFEARR